jgi:hypothetical protein
MPSGFIQLLSVGTEYEYLNKNPHISFFKAIYRRYSNFYIKTVQLYNKEINNNKSIHINNHQTFIIPSSGDLMTNTFIKMSYNNNSYEILKYYVDQIDTKSFDIFSFYDNYNILTFKYSKTEIENLEIIKINYYNNNNNYFTIWTSNLIKNKDLITNLIKFDENIQIQKDITNNYYNIYLLYNYFGFISLVNPNNLLKNRIFYNIIDCINFEKIDYIRIDIIPINSYKIYTNNKKFFSEFNTIILNNYLLNNQTMIKIYDNNIYYKIISENKSVYTEYINNSIKKVSKLLNIEIITNNKSSNKILISYDDYIKNLNTNKINSTIIIYLPNCEMNTNMNIYYYSKNIYFGNYDNYDYNESLILIEKNHITLSNNNLINKLSLLTYIRLFLKIGCYTEIDILTFLNNVKDKKFINNLENYYALNNNVLFNNILDVIVNKDVLIFNNSSYRSLIFIYENYIYRQNKINPYFYSNKVSTIQNIIILKNIYKNLIKTINTFYITNTQVLNFSINSSILLNFLNQNNNLYTTYVDLYNIIINYEYNNYFFTNNINIQYNFLGDNLLLKKYIFLYNFIIFILINFILNSIEPINIIYSNSASLNITNNTFNIYNNLGKYKNILNTFTYSISVFPLTSFLYLNQYTNDNTLLNSKIFENYTSENYNNNIFNNILQILYYYDQLFDTNIFGTITTYTIEDIKYVMKLFNYDFLNIIDNYYKNNAFFINSIDFKEINIIFKYYSKNQVIFVYNEYQDTSILKEIFSKVDNTLFGETFITYIKNITYLNTDSLYVYKFLFIVNSPFYRIYMLIRLLSFFGNTLTQDYLVLKQYLIFYLLVYTQGIDYARGADNSFTNFLIDNDNFDNLLPINNFISYDKINVVDNNDITNQINNLIFDNTLLLYSNFYFLKNFTKIVSNTTKTNVDNIYSSIYNSLKYNYDDNIFNNLITQLQKNNQLFYNIDNINYFLNLYFDKNTFNYTEIISELALNTSDQTIITNDLNQEQVLYRTYYATYSIGTLFDNTNKLIIDTINNTYNLYLNTNLISTFNDIYLIKTFDIKQYTNFITNKNITNGFYYFDSLFNNINNNASQNDIYYYYEQINNSIYKYIIDNFIYINSYLIENELFNLYLGYFTDSVNLFNSTNNTNINLFTYLPNEYNTYKKFIINSKIIIIYFLYKSFIEQCMFLDVKYYINELNTNTSYITFEEYIISKYSIFIYTDILNELIKNINKNIKNLLFDYSRIEIFFISNNSTLNNFTTVTKDIYLSNYINSSEGTKPTNITSAEGIYNINTYNSFYINLFQSNFNIQVINIAFYKNIKEVISSFINEILTYLFFLLNNVLINLIVKTDIYINLNDINQINKNIFYNNGINTIKDVYNEIQSEYDSNFYSLIKNSSLINKIFILVGNFYGKDITNYYNTIFYKYNFEINEITYDINSYIKNFINNKICYTTVCEKEVNRFLYYYMTKYCIKYIKTLKEDRLIDMIDYIKNNSTYQYVKMYNILYLNSKDIVYEENLQIYQNEQILSLLNIDFFTDEICTINNSYFVDFISNISGNYNDDNSFYKNYQYFYTFLKDNLGDLFNSVKINNINAFDYFYNISNIDEFNNYINNFLTLQEYYSPYYIYDNIIKYKNNNLNIDTKIEIEVENILKKIIIYLFMIYLIFQRLPIYINENLNLRTNYILEYTIIDDKVSFPINDVLDSTIISDLKKLIYDIYSIDPKYNYYTNDYEYEDIYIVNIILNNLKNVRLENYINFVSIYLNSYINNVISVSNKSSFINLINEINDIFINDSIYNNYQLNIYSGYIDQYYYESNLYNLNEYDNINSNLNNNSSNSLFFENLSSYYDKTDIYNINILLLRIILYLEVFDIKVNIEKINNIISNTRLNAIDINPTLENANGYNSYNDNLFIYQENNDYLNINNYLFRNRLSWNYILNLMVNNNQNDLSLITPIDYDFDSSFSNFGNIYAEKINIYKKFYNSDYNFYLYPKNYVGIYEKKAFFYNYILISKNGLLYIKKENYNLYKLIFDDIILTKYSNAYISYDNTQSKSYFTPIFTEILSLYFSYKNVFKYSYGLNNLYLVVNKYFINLLDNSTNSTDLIAIRELINEVYFYQLFGILSINYNSNSIQKEYIDFINQMNLEYNINFEYSNNYNILYKLKIQYIIIIDYLNKNRNYNLNIDNDYTKFIFDELYKLIVSKENINKFIYQNKIYYLIDIIEYNELLDLLSNSIGILSYYEDYNYDYYLNLVYNNNFKNKYFTTYDGKKVILSYYQISFVIKNYLLFILSKDILEEDSIYFNITTLLNQYINNNNILIDNVNNIGYLITDLIYKLQNSFYYGSVIKNYDKIINNDLLELKLTFLNYYFIKLNNNIEGDINIIQINKNLLILYKIFILVEMTINISNNLYYDVLLSVITKAKTIIFKDNIIPVLDLTNDIIIKIEYSNYVSKYNLLNYIKDILNTSIIVTKNYGINNFNNIVADYDYNKIFNLIYINNIYQTEQDIYNNLFGNVILNLLDINQYIQYYADLSLTNVNIVVNTINVIINNIKLELKDIQNIYGGHFNKLNTPVTLNINKFTEYFSTNLDEYENKNINIFTLIYSAFENENNNINYQLLVVLFYNIFMLIYLYIYGNNFIEYFDIILVNLCNIIYKNIIIFYNNQVDSIDYLKMLKFFEGLNILIKNNYSNPELIILCGNFFNNEVNINFYINKIIINNQVNSFLIKTYNGSEKYDGYKITGITNEYYKKYVNNKILIFKHLLTNVFDVNQSILILYLKSIIPDNIVNIQKDYIQKLKTMTRGFISNKGILKLINKIELYFDNDVVDSLSQETLLIYYNLIENINKIKTLDEFYGLDDDYINYGLRNYILKYDKDYYIPIYFFYKEISKSISLISSMYVSKLINVSINDEFIIKSFYNVNTIEKSYEISLLLDFIYVEKNERKILTENRIDNLINIHNNFISMVQYDINDLNNNNTIIYLDFSFNDLTNSIYELFWNVELNINNILIGNSNNNSININDLILSTIIYFNNNRRDGIKIIDNKKNYNKITTTINKYKYCTRGNNINKNVYSFSLEPNNIQPSGSINCYNVDSLIIEIAIDNIKLKTLLENLSNFITIENISWTMNLCAFSYNFLRYQSGLSGLLFKNSS